VFRKTLIALSEKVGYRLRGEGLAARTVFIKVRTADFTTSVRHQTLPGPFDLTETICREARFLFRFCRLHGQKVRLLGVGVSGLGASENRQGDLFCSAGEERRKRASEAIDRLKDRYGDGIIGRGK
jgi:DNA polymerase-4